MKQRQQEKGQIKRKWKHKTFSLKQKKSGAMKMQNNKQFFVGATEEVCEIS